VQAWRLIPYRLDAGKNQMHLDRCLLSHLSKNSEPAGFLRFYSWQPSALSLGLNQAKIPNHWHELIKTNGLDLVRRPTGGRAVLHQGDLCYALITRAPFEQRSLNYEYFCRFLIKGLGSLGISVDFGERQQSYMHQPNCFAIATGADLVISSGEKIGLKLVGSAQVYDRGIVLQHGSILVQPERQIWQDFFGEDYLVTGLAEILKYPSHQLTELIQTLILYLSQAACLQFEMELTEIALSMAELGQMGLDLREN